jgi:hypothetical protein
MSVAGVEQTRFVNSRYELKRSGPNPPEWATPSRSGGNATSKSGYERRALVACSLLLTASTLTHAFASCMTQRTFF